MPVIILTLGTYIRNMGLGLSFPLTVLLGFGVRIIAYFIAKNLPQNITDVNQKRKKSKKTAKILQIIMLGIAGFIISFPTFDLIGLSLTTVYGGILFIDLLVSDPIMRLLRKISSRINDLIKNSPIIIWGKDKSKLLKEAIKKLFGIKKPENEEQPVWKALLEFLASTIKEVGYELIAKKLIISLETMLANLKEIIDWLLDNISEALWGDILTEIMRWITYLLITPLQLFLKILRGILDFLFSLVPTMDWSDFMKYFSSRKRT